MAHFGNRLLKIAYLLFPATYVFAVAAYGLTRPGALVAFQWFMGLVFLLWLAGHLFQSRFPRTGIWPWVFGGAILLFGWIVTGVGYANSGVWDAWEQNVPVWVNEALGSYEWELSCSAMLRTTALLGGMLIAIDYWRDVGRGKILLITIAATALGTVLFFITQELGPDSLRLKALDGRSLLAFATYRYHGNAASFLNLAWPFCAAIALFVACRQSYGWPLWFFPFTATFVAIFLNVSKAGNVLGAVGIFIFLGLSFPFLLKTLKRSKRKIRRSRIAAAAVPVILIMIAIPFALPWKRWDQLSFALSQASGTRPDIYPKFYKMIFERSAVGFGPGTFPAFGDLYLENEPIVKTQHFETAHEDYLQTVIEWGYVGAALWALLLLPPVVPLLKGILRSSSRNDWKSEDYRIGLLDHVRVFFQSVPSPREACVAAAGSTGVVLTALHAATDLPMQIASIQFYFLTVIALGWSYLSPATSQPAK